MSPRRPLSYIIIVSVNTFSNKQCVDQSLSPTQWRIQEMFVGEAEKSEEVDKYTKRRKLGVRGFLPQFFLLLVGGAAAPPAPPLYPSLVLRTLYCIDLHNHYRRFVHTL